MFWKQKISNGMGQKQTLGKLGENIAEKFLKEKGYKILERHYCLRGGEIDLIAKDGDFIVFIEVKTRTSDKFGNPEESVNYFKQKKMAHAIKYYLWKEKIENKNIRFDVISIEMGIAGDNKIEHFENVELDL